MRVLISCILNSAFGFRMFIHVGAPHSSLVTQPELLRKWIR